MILYQFFQKFNIKFIFVRIFFKLEQGPEFIKSTFKKRVEIERYFMVRERKIRV